MVSISIGRDRRSVNHEYLILITLSNIHEVSCITQIIMIDDVRATIPFGHPAPEIVSGRVTGGSNLSESYKTIACCISNPERKFSCWGMCDDCGVGLEVGCNCTGGSKAFGWFMSEFLLDRLTNHQERRLPSPVAMSQNC